MTYRTALNTITLIAALIVASAAAYLSVVGLMVIFSAEALTVAVIISILEATKFVTVAFAHLNWSTFKRKIKVYFVMAVLALMSVTGLGVYGFFSKAHLEQSASAKINVLKNIELSKIKISAYKRQIEDEQTQINLINANVTAATKKGHVKTAKNLKNSAAKEIATREQKKFEITEQLIGEETKLADYTEQLKQKDLKLGPIRYVAQLFVDKANEQDMSTAVRWMIILLLLVFDPLAVILIIAHGTVMLETEARKRASQPVPVRDDWLASKPVSKPEPVIVPKPKPIVRIQKE